jgi:hypothetical protein
MIPWHRLFGLILGDFFSGTAWEVVLELDLSRKVQRLERYNGEQTESASWS